VSFDIQSSVPGELLQAALNLQGRIPLQMGRELVPTIQVGEMLRAFAPAKVRGAQARMVQAAVAAQFPCFRIVAETGVLIELVEFVATPVTPGFLEFEYDGSVTGAVTEQAKTGQAYTDSRVRLGGGAIGPPSEPAARLFTGTQVAGVAGEYAVPIAAVGTVYRPVDMVIGRAPFQGPAELGIFFETAVNEIAVLSVQWREWFLI